MTKDPTGKTKGGGQCRLNEMIPIRAKVAKGHENVNVPPPERALKVTVSFLAHVTLFQSLAGYCLL